MSTREDLERATLPPEAGKAVVGALADWRMEYLGEGRFTALKKALEPRRALRNAAQIAEAARLLRSDDPVGPILRSLVADALLLGHQPRMTITVVAGRRWPQILIPAEMGRGGRWRPVHVVVGARWVLHLRERPRPGRRVSRRAIELGRRF